MNLTPELTQQQRTLQGPLQDQKSACGNQFYTDFQTSAACLVNHKRMYFVLFRLLVVSFFIWLYQYGDGYETNLDLFVDNLPTSGKVTLAEPLSSSEEFNNT